tara:strand:- start:314 stop:838 length:525 start_codon:yes stop_codon:yes gene_type:complete
MKQIITLSIILLAFSSLSQTINYSDLDTNKRPRGKFKVYVSQSGDSYSVGDTLVFGSPSGVNGKFIYITYADAMGQVYPVGAGANNINAEIRKIRVTGSKRQGYRVNMQFKATIIGWYFVNFEDAIQHGELISKGMTSDQALAELKKAKDKLDLELITQLEYDKIKAKLIKYIK